MYFGLAILFLTATYIGLSYFIAVTAGPRHDLGVMDTFILCLMISPLGGFLFTRIEIMFRAKGCKWCGSMDVVHHYCEHCGMDVNGKMQENFVPRSRPVYQKPVR